MGGFVIGQKAVIYQDNIHAAITIDAVVERDTKLYWIANGRKFRKSDGMEPGTLSSWTRGRYLLPSDDPRVVEAVAEAKRGKARFLVTKAMEALQLHPADRRAIQALRDALDHYEATLS